MLKVAAIAVVAALLHSAFAAPPPSTSIGSTITAAPNTTITTITATATISTITTTSTALPTAYVIHPNFDIYTPNTQKCVGIEGGVLENGTPVDMYVMFLLDRWKSEGLTYETAMTVMAPTLRHGTGPFLHPGTGPFLHPGSPHSSM